MNEIHLSNIDLNLLTVFDAVMRERNATRAAERIGLTQPAISHALNRLRTVLGDPLFVRTPKGMVPTPRAAELAPPIASMLEQVTSLLNRGKDFVLGQSRRRFLLGLSDYASFVALPALMERVRAAAPGIALTVKNVGHGDGLARIEEGGVELIVGNFPEPPPHIRREVLFHEGFVCAGREGHPGMGRTLTMKRYLALEHLQVSTRGDPHGYVDDVLDKMRLRRDVRVTVGHFLAAPFLLERSDLIATEPERLLSPLRKKLGLVLAKPPFSIPSFEVTQCWHARHDCDPGHAWLRGQVVELLRK